MYGIIGEDKSDANVIKELIHRLANDRSLTIKTKGYEGCPQMLRKGANQIKLFVGIGLTRFVVAYDSDGDNPVSRRDEVMRRIVKPSGAPNEACCILIPVQEIEAWILADIQAVSKVIKSWHPAPISGEPESIPSPKEHLERLSRIRNKRPVYEHATHNEKVVKFLQLDIVRARCPSFVPLAEFVARA